MAKYRQLYTEFWMDGFVVDLTPEEKYFYLYLMTNTKTSQCGIYELPVRIIVNDTGYNHETVKKLLKRFEEYNKILYCDETKEIMIINWGKYNPPNNINSIKCINKELNNIKNENFLQMFYVQCRKNNFDCEKIFKGLYMVCQGAYEDHASNEVISNKQEVISNKQEIINNEEEVRSDEHDVINNKQEIKSSIEEVANDNFSIDNCDLKSVIKVFDNNIHPITPIEYEKLQYWANEVSCSVIVMAIEEAVNHNARTMKYIDKILFCWVGKGIKTVEGVEAYLREWEQKKKSSAKNGQAKSKFCDYDQRNYDFKELERGLLGLDGGK